MAIVELPRHLYAPKEKLQLVDYCFADGTGTPLTNHKGYDSGPWKSLYDVLTDAGCPPQIVHHFLTEKGTWRKEFFAQHQFKVGENPTKKSILSVLSVARAYLLEAGQYSLDHQYAYGYNDHRDSHIRRVSMMTRKLLEFARQSAVVQHRGAVAADNHDTFNLLSRELHQHGAGLFLAALSNILAEDKENFAIIERAMHLHTEKVAEPVFAMIRDENPNIHIFYKRLLELVGPEALALIIADKIDLRPERAMNVKGLTKESLENDPHFLLNLAAATTNFKLSEHGQNVFWDMSFSPEAIFSILHLEDEAGYAMYGAAVANNPNLLPDLEKWFSSFWDIYFDRVKLVAISTFALFPSVKKLRLTIRDESSSTTSVVSHEIVLTKEGVEDELQAARERYTRNTVAA